MGGCHCSCCQYFCKIRQATAGFGFVEFGLVGLGWFDDQDVGFAAHAGIEFVGVVVVGFVACVDFFGGFFVGGNFFAGVDFFVAAYCTWYLEMSQIQIQTRVSLGIFEKDRSSSSPHYLVMTAEQRVILFLLALPQILKFNNKLDFTRKLKCAKRF